MIDDKKGNMEGHVTGEGAGRMFTFGKKAQARREQANMAVMEPVSVPHLLTVEQVAERLGKSKKAVHAMVGRKQIPHLKIGESTRFVPHELLEWLRHKSIAVACEGAA